MSSMMMSNGYDTTSWRFADMIPGSPPEAFRLPGVVETPAVLHDVPDLGPCLFKMEQDCPTGSHKDRAAVFQVSIARQKKSTGLIIPSSGNAAIAVSAAGLACDLPVYAFLSPETPGGKLAALARYKPRMVFCSTPVNRARNASRRFGLPNLRPSRDDNAVNGFMTLGFELAELLRRKPFSSIFVFSTSGATLTGIARAFTVLQLTGRLRTMPEFHAVQAGNASDLARLFDTREVADDADFSLSGAGFGGVPGSRLLPELADYIRGSRGGAWMVNREEMSAAGSSCENLGIQTSPEGWCALAAACRWRREGGIGTPLIVLTGRHRDTVEPCLDDCFVCHAKTYHDVECFISRWHPVL